VHIDSLVSSQRRSKMRKNCETDHELEGYGMRGPAQTDQIETRELQEPSGDLALVHLAYDIVFEMPFAKPIDSTLILLSWAVTARCCLGGHWLARRIHSSRLISHCAHSGQPAWGSARSTSFQPNFEMT